MISFEGRVALVTGAGGGLGRAYALALAARGARVVVNDLSAENATAAVEEIERNGGSAVAAAGSVADADAIERAVADAKARWGGLHVLINNAGLLRDRSFAKMTREEWDTVLSVHLGGTYNATRAVWETMREQGYGRILVTTSSNGLYGAFGQANYSAAKAGLVGLMKTLSIEGAKYGIRANAIAPIAGTGMTAADMRPELYEAFSPDRVAPVALYLVSEDAPTNAIACTGGGMVVAAQVVETPGMVIADDELSPEGVAARWGEIADMARATVPASGGEQIRRVFQSVMAERGIAPA